MRCKGVYRYSRCGDGCCVKYQPYILPNEATFALYVPIQRHNGDPWRIIYITPLAIVGEASGSPSEPVSLAVRKTGSKQKMPDKPPGRYWRYLSRRSICRGFSNMENAGNGHRNNRRLPCPDSGRDETSAVQPPARPPEMGEAFSTLFDLIGLR